MNRGTVNGLREGVRPLDEYSPGDIIGYWKPFTAGTKFGGSSPPLEWIYEIGEVEKVPPFMMERETAIPTRDGGYKRREVVGVLKVRVDHIKITEDGEDIKTWAGTTDYVHPNMIGNWKASDSEWGQAEWRVMFTEDGFPTSLASENMAVNYGRRHLETELPAPPESVDPWDPPLDTTAQTAAADGGRV